MSLSFIYILTLTNENRKFPISPESFYSINKNNFKHIIKKRSVLCRVDIMRRVYIMRLFCYTDAFIWPHEHSYPYVGIWRHTQCVYLAIALTYPKRPYHGF